MHVYVEGRVQGVFFRSSVQDQAEQLGISGYVRNLPDGRLEAEFQGPNAAVDRLVDFCREGPSQSYVEHVEVEPLEVSEGDSGFRVV